MDFNDLKLLIEPTVNKIGYELTDLEMKWSGENNLIRIFIDRPEGIGLEDCEAVSQQIGMLMDIEEPITDDYVLEVSSPGLDRKLTKIDHYLQFLGEEVRYDWFPLRMVGEIFEVTYCLYMKVLLK